jgi:hypothetical protein
MVRLVAAALLVALLAGCGAKAPEDPSPSLQATADTGLVVGVVVDEGIRPLGGANVTLASQPPRSAVTGADGAFGFGQVPPGTYRVEARKPGYADAATTVDVEAGVDDPPNANLQLSFNPALVPFVEAVVFEGFVECSFHLRGGYFAACAAGPIANNLVCSETGTCPGNVTNDRVFAFQTVTGTPDFVQAELAWETTQSLGDWLMLFENYGTLDEFNGGGFAGTFNTTQGPSPIFVTVNATELQAAEIGTTNHLVPEVLAGPNEATQTCLPDQPAVRPCGGYGVAVEQRFSLFTHLFYNFLPPAGWRFSVDGTPSPPT